MSKRRQTSNGGRVARKAVMRWAWRLFRREWRQQAVVLGLLTVAVSAAVCLTTAVTVISPAAGRAQFGSANHRFTLDDTDPATVEATVAAADDWFEQTEVIRRQKIRLPGRSDPIETRAQDPEGALSAPMLELRSGRYPVGAGEVALAETLAVQLGVEAGEFLELADGESMNVVGLVENPNRLDDRFGLLPLEAGPGSGSVTILVSDTTTDRALSFGGVDDANPVYSSLSSGEGIIAAVALLAVTELSLVLVSLIAAAGFVVVAQRRQRQLGMLAAIGATERHLRLVVISNGAIIGGIAASVGTAVGLLAWFVVAPALEQTIGLRIDRLGTPWWLVGLIATLAIVTATAASWWPASLAARVPITQALAGRRPRPRKSRRSIVLAGMIIAAGVVAVASAGDVFDPMANGVNLTNAFLSVSGTIAIVSGVLLFSPSVIAGLASVPHRFPLSVRLAFRDLGRYQARSAMALAAISLALGLPMAIIVGISAAESRAEEGNLSGRHLLVTTVELSAPFVDDVGGSEQEVLDSDVDELAVELGAERVVELHKVVDPTRELNEFGLPTLRISRPDEVIDGPPVFLAAEDLLDVMDLSVTGSDAELITSEVGDIKYAGVSDPATGREGRLDVEDEVTIDPGYSSMPMAMMTPEGVEERGWETRPAGWLIELSEPLSDADVAKVRDQAIANEFSVETRDNQRGLLQLRTIATVVGLALALGVLALTVGLVRTEATRDLQTLTASGATSILRRALVAATAAGLALLGTFLGLVGAYLGLIFNHIDDLSALTPIPSLHLGVLSLGVPAIAALAGWVFSGREPNTIRT